MGQDSDTSKHVGEPPRGEPVPEPPFAERARTLMHVARVGTLTTQSRHVPGFPFGSVALFGLDGAGQPTFLVSTMAMHTQNLAADNRASLLVAQPGWAEDPLAGARLTLVGPITPAPPDAVAAIRDEYLARHDNARHWVDFGDFAFYRMQVTALYYVAGFGAMGWVEADEYRAAGADPLADSAPGIIAHMNEDHRDALLLYCRVFADVPAEEATMTAVDRMGMRIRARAGDRLQGLRINFPREVRTPTEARVVLVEMVKDARARTAGR